MQDHLNRPNQVAVVTGAGSGIGRAVTLRLLENGYRVALMEKRADAMAETIALAAERADATLGMPTDVTDPQAVAAGFEAVIARWGRVDLLFNNAGTFDGTGPLDELPPEIWRFVIDVNLSGAFFCAQAAYRCMKAQDPKGGRIINNGSVSAQVPRPNAIAYNASKHAISGLTKSIALEGRAHGIACGQIDIGNAATEMTQGIAKGFIQADGEIRPEPTIDVRNIADAVLCMASMPLETNVLSLTVMASGMPFVGRG